jgi:hypothetical protein
MSRRNTTAFATVRTEGAILPADLLERVAEGDKGLQGLTPTDYYLAKTEKIGEAVSRSWNRLVGLWRSFESARDELLPGDRGTTLTRERWLLPLFQELGYERLPGHKATEIGGKTYPVSHMRDRTPIHLTSFRIDLDQRAEGVAGAARMSPHSLVQELLNRSEDHLWGFVSNGLRLRILRDNASLTRQAYVEFDLESMFQGESFADFSLFWLLCHRSRTEGEKPEDCWLERWSQAAHEEGARALDQLREGVEKAIIALGQGFLAHPANGALRESLRSGALHTQDYYRELLRLVYRLIFLFVAEDRGLLLDPEAGAAARERFLRYYSSRRIRDLAGRQRGSRHADLYEGLKVVAAKLGDPDGCPELAIKPLGSFLWSQDAVAHLSGMIANRDFLEAVRPLAYRVTGGALRPVDYKNLRSEELGSVYEALLELHPEMNVDAAVFELRTLGGHERKTSGSYYTPDSLVQCLLDTALDPVVKDRLEAAAKEAWGKPEDVYEALAEKALLSLKVCDPAVGSGHFLIAASHRIAKHLASVRTGEGEPGPDAYRRALRDVIGHCLYGVDINSMAVELCKVALWMEAMVPGKPLSFLDGHIRCGNSLLGATPALMAKGIPEEAFNSIEGDDKEVVKRLRKQHREERRGQMTLFADFAAEAPPAYSGLTSQAETLEARSDETIRALQEKEAGWHRFHESEEYRRAKLLADAWCAAFVWPKTSELEGAAVTEGLWRRLQQDVRQAPAATRAEVERLAAEYQFFHWHLAFPQVFLRHEAEGIADDENTGWSGGFDVVLGNPPWEQVEIKEQEFFAALRPDIAQAENAAARKRMIEGLAREDPTLHSDFRNALRKADGETHLLRNTGCFPLCARGRINTYSVFAELNRTIVSRVGRVGCVLPAGIAMDDNTKLFFQDIVDRGQLASLFHFENEDRVFPVVHHAYRFCLLTMSGTDRPVEAAQFVAFARQVGDLHDPTRRYTLAAADFAHLNPNTRTLPTFRTRRDAEITKALYRKASVLVRDGTLDGNPWGVSFRQGIFNMASDSRLFCTQDQLNTEGWALGGNVFERDGRRMLPLYEAKMVHHFDHRFGTYEGQTEAQSAQGKLPETTPAQHDNPDFLAMPRYWVEEAEVESRLEGRWDRGWMLGWRDICRNNDMRTVIAGVVPPSGTGDTFLLAFPDQSCIGKAGALAANLTSFVLDFAARQKVGGTHLKYHVFKQLPVLAPALYDRSCPWAHETSIGSWLARRVLELQYTAWDHQLFAWDLGYDGPPFHWDEERRFQLRCELDAAFFHLYGVERDDAAYILGTFPVVQRRDETRFDSYRTRDRILEVYDLMQCAIETGVEFRSALAPPPGPPTDAAGDFMPVDRWDPGDWPSNVHRPRGWGEAVPVPSWRTEPYREDPQVFPWSGREAFVFTLLPHLVAARPGEVFEYYRDAALLASRLDDLRKLLPESGRARLTAVPESVQRACSFDAAQRTRPSAIREDAVRRGWVRIDGSTGVTTPVDGARLPSLDFDFTHLEPLVFEGAVVLKDLRRDALPTDRQTLVAESVRQDLDQLVA